MKISPESQEPKLPPKFRLHSLFSAAYLVLLGAALGGVGTWMFLKKVAAVSTKEWGIKSNPGPWGDLYYVPFTISAPEETLPVRAFEARGTTWFFKGYTRENLERVLNDLELTSDTRNALLDPNACRVTPGGIYLSPTVNALMDLSETARKRIYQALAQFPENRAELVFIHKKTLKDRFADGGISQDTLTLFRQFCCEHGDYLVLSGLATLLAQLPSYEEKARFLKGITQQKTMLLRIHQTKQSDTAALANYWGKGSKSTDVRTILESFSRIPSGTWVNILMVLPSTPASELYEYPLSPDNPLKGPTYSRDCHWTTFNFFRSPPASNVTPDNLMEDLKANYAPAVGDPRYGDVLLFSKPDGEVIHSCIYLADDIVFTKNGGTAISPWMLEKLSDLLNQYSFQVPEGKELTLAYYRHNFL